MRDMIHTRDSANIAYYAEDAIRADRVYCEVLRSDHYWTGSGKRRVLHHRERPVFHISIYRDSVRGEVAKRRYVPRKPVPPGPLPCKTVTDLVRRALISRRVMS